MGADEGAPLAAETGADDGAPEGAPEAGPLGGGGVGAGFADAPAPEEELAGFGAADSFVAAEPVVDAPPSPQPSEREPSERAAVTMHTVESLGAFMARK